jgi:hypothetical protein
MGKVRYYNLEINKGKLISKDVDQKPHLNQSYGTSRMFLVSALYTNKQLFYIPVWNIFEEYEVEEKENFYFHKNMDSI